MKIERLLHRRVGAALRRHRMIEEGDRILLAISGGVDSSAMARILAEKRRNLPVRFELVGCVVETDLFGYAPGGSRWLNRYFEDLGIPLIRRRAAVLARMAPDRKLSCFFCAMQRRKALVDVALEERCSKIAYGHHMDDIIETLLLNMFYNAEISTMPARLELDDHDLVLIRPMCLAKEAEVKRYARRFEMIEAVERCPHGDRGRRAAIKKIIKDLAEVDGRVRDNISASLGRVKPGYLVEKSRNNA